MADILLEDHEPLGLSFASVLAEAPALYLQFLAVRRDLRGGGLGRVLWDRAVLARAADTGAPGIVLEVEDPDVAAADAERRQALRRIVFYERLGASLLPVTGYRVPRADGPGELALRLMWAPAPGGPPGPPALRRLVMALYGEGYGLPAGHPLVVATEGDLPEPEEGGP